jgi:LacI family transcriptional regulator
MMRGCNPRLQDVADLAKVSLSAASRILRGDQASFSPAACRRVAEAAQQLGWRRNLLVSGMQTGRTGTIGVVIPPYDSFWVSVLSGIHTRLAQADVLPITVWLGDIEHMPHFEAGEKQGVDLMNRLLDRRVDGLLLWPPFALAYTQHTRELRDRRVPVVMIDYHAEQAMCDTVTTNEGGAMRAVARHLHDLGHRRIAYVGTYETPSRAWATERRRSLESQLEGLGNVSYQTWRLNREGSDGPAVASRLLRSRLRPTAVVTATDHEAIHVYRAAGEQGIRIPDDLSVVGFADLDFAATMTPPLTTVRQRATEIGMRAAAQVLERVERPAPQGPFLPIRVEADLVLRGSTGPAATLD